MSGIVGAFYLDKTARIDPDRLQQSHAAIARWGPDGGSTVSVAGCGLGQSRWASDEPNGDGSPFWDAERRLVSVFDGVLRTPGALKRSLEAQGHRFRSETQSELVLAAYRQWGIKCVDHLFGAFAFAIFDRRAHAVFLARDRVGHRPLYLHRGADRVCFSTGLDGLFAWGAVPRVLDPEAADDFLTLGFVPGPATLLRDVRTLPPGAALYADRHQVQQWSYWAPNFEPDRTKNLEQSARALIETVDGAMAAPPPGSVVALSGGLASGFVAASAARAWVPPTRAVTVVGWGATEEALPASETAGGLDLHHASVRDTSPVQELWSKLLEDGEPPFDPMTLAWFRLGQGVARVGTTAYTGLGSDLVFAGETRYRRVLRSHELKAQIGRITRGGLGRGAAATPASLQGAFTRRVGTSAHRSWYAQDFLRGLKGHVPFGAPQCGAVDGLSRLQSLDWTTAVPAHLHRSARLEIHTGLRLRHPFLDRSVLDLVGRSPERYRLDADHDRVILRRAARRSLPAALTERASRPIVPPSRTWLAGPLRDRIQIALFEAPASGLFQAKALRQAWYRMVLGDGRGAVSLWRIAALEAWLHRALR